MIFKAGKFGDDYTLEDLRSLTKADVVAAYEYKLDIELLEQGYAIASDRLLEARCVHDTFELNFFANQVE